MSRKIIDVPLSFLRMVECNWDIDWRGQSLGDSTAGNAQVYYNKMPRWRGTLSIALVRGDIGVWRSIRARARGHVNVYRIPMFDPACNTTSLAGVRWSDGALFDDNTLFWNGPYWTAAARAREGSDMIKITGVGRSGVQPSIGQIISIGDWPYQISGIDGNCIWIEMPLRREVPRFSRISTIGYGLFEVANESQGTPAYDGAQVSFVDIDLVEALRR